MIRDTFFSMSRFVNLCRKEMVESWKTNLLRFVMMYGILAIAFLLIGFFKYKDWPYIKEYYKNTDPVWEFALIIFVAAILIMGMLSASFVMERMKSKTNRIAVLMTPATMFEKFFSRWLIFTLGFLIFFIVAFKMADWTRVAIYMASYPEINEIAPMPLSFFGHWGIFEDKKGIMFSMGLYIFAQSLFVLGSSVWPKNAFVKTFSAIVVIVIVYFVVGASLGRILLFGHGFYKPVMSGDTLMLIVTIGLLVFACFNWVLAYFRFKESEIINRW